MTNEDQTQPIGQLLTGLSRHYFHNYLTFVQSQISLSYSICLKQDTIIIIQRKIHK